MFGFQPLAKVPISDDVVDSVPVTLTATGVSGTGQVGSVSVSGVADTPITGLEASAGPHATVTFAVTVANSGSGNKFYIDGSEAPTLSLTRNTTYVFDVSDSSVSGHPLAFKDGNGNSYTTGVTVSGTAGSSGAKVTFVVPGNAPSSLRYYCTVHGNGMGNTITTSTLDFVSAGANVGVTGVAGTMPSVPSDVIVETGTVVVPTGVQGGTPNPLTSVGFTDVTIVAIRNISFSVSGVSATGGVGQAVQSLPIGFSVTGVGSTTEINGVTVSGATDIPQTGIAASGSVGSITVESIGNIAATGVEGTGSVNSVTASIPISQSVSGVSGSVEIGSVSISLGANAVITAPSSATGAVDSVTIVGESNVPETGLAASGSIGTSTVSGAANFSVTGISGSTGVGTAIQANVYPVGGLSATGSIGSVSIVGISTIPSTGISATGSIGQVRMYTAVQPEAEVPIDPYSALVIDVPIEDVYTDLDLTGVPAYQDNIIPDAA